VETRDGVSRIRTVPEPSRIDVDRRRDHPVDLTRDREFVAGRIRIQPPIFHNRGVNGFILAFPGPPRTPIGQGDLAQYLGAAPWEIRRS
jgi:hypothetical protein